MVGFKKRRSDIAAEVNMIRSHHEWLAAWLKPDDPLREATGIAFKVGKVRPPDERKLREPPTCPVCKARPRPWQASQGYFRSYCGPCNENLRKERKAKK